MNNFKETDLYEPIKNMFEKLGYKVQGEVGNCDVVCIKDNLVSIVEMKKYFNLKVLYQAIERKSFCDFVYVAIIRPKSFRTKEKKAMFKILKSLNIGLITVSLDSPLKFAEIVLEPFYKKEYQNKRRKSYILNEVSKRNLNINLGGSSKKDKILTSYREQSIYIACLLERIGATKGVNIKKITGIEKATYILRNNYYGYFEKVERGVYSLSQIGINMLSSKDFKEAILYYKEQVDKVV